MANRRAELITLNQDVRRQVADNGFAWIPGSAWSIAEAIKPDWQRLREDWDHLEPDGFLAPGATFRRRRYGRYYWSPASDDLRPLPVAPYFQPEDENAYAGGVAREFAPLLGATLDNPFLRALIRSNFAHLPVASEKEGQNWEVRIHQIRIVASAAQAGHPSPEGIHQDGTDFLTLHLVRRQNIAGGASTIYDLNRRPLQHYTLRETLDSFILEDPRIMHGVTPVQPADGRTLGVRDLLGVDYIFSPLLRPVACGL